ncbi:maleylacetoacetate isomerase [Vandammella animalimorsus]|uniref:Maleylacetoacetate isomerase n=1 Tax=Vandammella animalimorsus TaxID=2029117 RepID=A0A2A2AVZ6_9BURK|nr:maleylacetoacetate isomerase [Vandammella animalimorsus]PAT41933.1 maleylacetoacetate isomerase [Vandammella animalimorsus]
MQLYNYFYSSTSYRVRIALALKQLPFDYLPINLRTLQQRTPEYLARNPAGSVPLLIEDDGFALTQSLAILDYLEQRHPQPALLPAEPRQRARVLELCHAIACDIHPVNNQRVLRYLQQELGLDDARKNAWYAHWIAQGLQVVEHLLAQLRNQGHAGPYCLGAQPSWADCCLVPQVSNALRMQCETDAYPLTMAVYRHCLEQAPFQQAAPMAQPDAPRQQV